MACTLAHALTYIVRHLFIIYSLRQSPAIRATEGGLLIHRQLKKNICCHAVIYLADVTHKHWHNTYIYIAIIFVLNSSFMCNYRSTILHSQLVSSPAKVLVGISFSTSLPAYWFCSLCTCIISYNCFSSFNVYYCTLSLLVRTIHNITVYFLCYSLRYKIETLAK